MSIPLFVTRDSIERLIPQVAERQRAVLESGRYILGPEVAAFEAEFAAYLGARHCVGVANGTEAITIALRALGIGQGDEVVVPAVTFFASAEAVVNAGATPVFCDIDPATYCMTPATVEPVLSPQTKALLAVHLFGNVAPVDQLRGLADERGIYVVEDSAQAAGATLRGQKAGSLGHVATFSFYPGKNLGAFGDAGAIVTNDSELMQQARRLRFHGSEDKVVHTLTGYNSRLDEMQAAGLRVLLPELEAWTEARRAAASKYATSALGDLVTLPTPTDGCNPCHHLYVVTTPERDQLRTALAEAGIESRPYYTVPMHLQPALQAFAAGALPEAERVADQNLALPMGQDLGPSEIDQVVAAVGVALGETVSSASQ